MNAKFISIDSLSSSTALRLTSPSLQRETDTNWYRLLYEFVCTLLSPLNGVFSRERLVHASFSVNNIIETSEAE